MTYAPTRLRRYLRSPRITSFTYNTNQQLTRLARPAGLTTTNLYGTDGYLSKTYDYALVSGATVYYRTNTFTYTNGLVYTHTNERGLTTTYAYDLMRRLTNAADSRGSFSYIYSNLDLIRVVDPSRSLIIAQTRATFCLTNDNKRTTAAATDSGETQSKADGSKHGG